MKVISLIPSMTETLLAAGVEVVGRTRFCVHAPREISMVGGTKDIDWKRVEALHADLLILDKEENPKIFSEQATLPWLAIHVESIASCANELERLSKELNAPRLQEFAERYRQLQPCYVDLQQVVEWITEVSPASLHLEYIIWKDPLMAVSRNTFIGDVLAYLGHPLPLHAEKYPKLTWAPNTTYLFSSEPYPFAKKLDWIREQKIPAALVNGENFSWFGIRNLQFLESLL